MCRALLYLGEPVLLDNLLYQPDSALVRQSYMPKMLNMLNLAGFGLRAWDPRLARAGAAVLLRLAVAAGVRPQPEEPRRKGARRLRARARARRCVFRRGRDLAAERAPVPVRRRALALAHNGDLAGIARSSRGSRRTSSPVPRQIRGTTDSEWIYALFVSQLADPHAARRRTSCSGALAHARDPPRGARRSSASTRRPRVNLFIANGRQLAAVRYCFDFGRYPTEDPARVHEANLSFLSLWYTLGRNYALHGNEWKMTGGAERAESILVASEPLTRDTSSWVELPEYGALFAEIRNGRPYVCVRLLD